MKEIKVTGCVNCPFASEVEDAISYYRCGATNKCYTLMPKDKTPEWCPIKEKPITVTL